MSEIKRIIRDLRQALHAGTRSQTARRREACWWETVQRIKELRRHMAHQLAARGGERRRDVLTGLSILVRDYGDSPTRLDDATEWRRLEGHVRSLLLTPQ
jgi:hypothetical protein